MKTLTKAQYDNICEDYKGIYIDYYGNHTELKGRKTMLADMKDLEQGLYPQLMVEGIHFKIV